MTRLEQIAERLKSLQRLMQERGPSDPCLELVREHAALVRERNKILNERTAQ